MKILLLLLIPFSALASNFAFTPSDDLAVGFKLYCGPTADQTGWIENADLVGFRPSGIETTFLATETTVPQGTNVCAMTAYNGISESAFSNVISFERIGDEVTASSPLAPAGFGLQP